MDYVNGVRGFPAWALGEMLYHYEGHAGKKLSNVETLIWAAEKTQPALLNALKRGRFYSRRRSAENALVLNEFSVNKIGPAARLSYYRVYLRGAYPLQLVSNPIFVE